MADVKISALPATAAQNTTDTLPKVDGVSGVTQKMTVAQLFALVTGRFKGAGVPSVAPAAGAGAGATATLDANASDVAGNVTLTPAGVPGIGDQFTVTFGSAFPNVPHIQFCSANANSAGVNVVNRWYTTNVTANGFTLTSSAATVAGTVYIVSYMVIA